MILDRGHDVAVGGDLRGHESLPHRDVFVTRERVLQVHLPSEVRVCLARHVRAVGVPREQVECGRLLAEQPPVDDVAEDEVVRAQEVEGVRHVLALEESRFLHAPDQSLHRVGVGEHRGQCARALVVNGGIEVCR